jgi:hypothetical protein
VGEWIHGSLRECVGGRVEEWMENEHIEISYIDSDFVRSF